MSFHLQEEAIFCNPLPMPCHPPGICSPSRHDGAMENDPYFIGPARDYRELADPEGIYFDGLWYLFPSARQAYVSRDLAHWEHRPLAFEGTVPDLGYAPSVARLGERFLLTSSILFRASAAIYEAPTPLGPYRHLGSPQMPDGSPIAPEWHDPSIFVDEDGRLYMYWHFGGGEGAGIFGAEFDHENPVHALSAPIKLVDFDSSNEFERYGENNEHPCLSYIEGEAIFKHNGKYYIQYACNGTIFRHYAIGVYRGSTPLGPFTVQRTPVALSPGGRVSGCGHGGWIQGPDGTIWQFYTCSVRRVHFFERRIGMDRVVFDGNGDAHVAITCTPQSVREGDLSWRPLSVNKPASASSSKGTNYPAFAVDDATHTWWMPEDSDSTPWLEVDLKDSFDLRAVQICWVEEGLDFRKGICPRPLPFSLEFFDGAHTSDGHLDWMELQEEHLIEFQTFPKRRARFVRLRFPHPLNSPLKHGVGNFTLFGTHPIISGTDAYV